MENASAQAFQPSLASRWDAPYPTAAPSRLSGTYCPVLFFDIAAFAHPQRDNDIQMFARDGLYRILRRTFDQIGLPEAAYYRQDYGDGVLAVIPPTTAIDTVAGLPTWLHLEIRRYNKCASPAARIQLRAALHIGPIYWDSHGVSGEALVHAARLIDAQPVKDELAAADADLVFVISEPVYGAVIRHSPQPGNAVYREIEARVKESKISAWITLSGARAFSDVSDHQPPLSAVPDMP
jgi:hypothetical protein